MIDPASTSRIPSVSDSPAFEALAQMVENAKRGEVRLPPPDLNSPRAPSAAHDRSQSGLPASWYRTATAETPDFRSDMLRAGVLGLGIGLVVLLPLLWWSGKPQRAKAPQVSFDMTGLTLASVQPSEINLSPVGTPAERMRALIELAKLRIIVGDVLAARTLLSRADVARDAGALFLLAETYDPNMLVKWRSHGVVGDGDRARALYAAANALGHNAADERLAGLK